MYLYLLFIRDQGYTPVSGLAPGSDGDMETLAYLVTQYPDPDTVITSRLALDQVIREAARAWLPSGEG